MDDDFVASVLPPTTTHNHLAPRRRNSISKPAPLPINLPLHHHPPSSTSSTASSSSSSSSSSSVVDFDLISIKPVSYTSLKDLLPPTAVSSPKPNSPSHSQSASGEISIKNRLVKQAAWAYLQPMSTAPDSTGRNFLHRIWIKLLANNQVAALRSFFDLHIFRRLNHAFDWLLRAVRIRGSR